MRKSTRHREKSTGQPIGSRIGGQAALAFALIALSAILCVLLTTLSTLVAERLVRDQISQRLLDLVTVSALHINGDLHKTLIHPEQEGGDAYREIQRGLQELRKSVSDVHYVYTMRTGTDGITFVVDEETTEEEIAHLGEIYHDAGPGLSARFASLDTPFVESEIYTDHWGSWLSGYAPFYDSDGRRAGILGMDIRADSIAAAKRRALGLNLVLLAVTLPLCVLSGWLLASRLIAPMRQIAAEAKDIIQCPKSCRTQDSRIKEVSTVGNALKLMRYLLDYSPVCHKIVDLDFNLLYMSRNGFQMLRLDNKDDICGKPYPFYFFPDAFQQEMKDTLKRVKATGATLKIDGIAMDTEGKDVLLHSTLVPVPDDNGKLQYITVVSSDVTAQRNLEAHLRQSQKLESIGTLASGVAHEINNPLMGMMNYAELGPVNTNGVLRR